MSPWLLGVIFRKTTCGLWHSLWVFHQYGSLFCSTTDLPNSNLSLEGQVGDLLKSGLLNSRQFWFFNTPDFQQFLQNLHFVVFISFFYFCPLMKGQYNFATFFHWLLFQIFLSIVVWFFPKKFLVQEREEYLGSHCVCAGSLLYTLTGFYLGSYKLFVKNFVKMSFMDFSLIIVIMIIGMGKVKIITQLGLISKYTMI